MAETIRTKIRIDTPPKVFEAPTQLSAVPPGSMFYLAGHHAESDVLYLLLDNGHNACGIAMGVARVGQGGTLTMDGDVKVIRVEEIKVTLRDKDLEIYCASLED